MSWKNAKGILTAVIILLLPIPLFSQSEQASVKSAKEILEKNMEAVGGEEAIRSINTVKMTAEVEIPGTGFKGTITSYSMKPCFLYTELSLKLFEMKTGFDGERAWVVDQNGNVQFKKDENSTSSRKVNCLLTNYNYLIQRENLDMELASPDTVEGRPCDVIKINHRETGTTIFLSFDKETHLLRRSKVDAGLNTIESEYSDYRPVNGVLFPFKSINYYIQIMQKFVVTYKSIEVNEPIDPAIFFPPPSSTVDYRFTNDAGLSTVRMNYSSRHIFIPVEVKRKETRSAELHAKGQCMYEEERKSPEPILFMLDSGASKSVIDSTLAAELGLEFGDRLPGTGAGGMAYFYAVRLDGFKVGDIEFGSQTIFSFPVSRLTEKFFGRSIGGILGYDFLSRFTTELNYEDSTVTFYHPDTFETIAERTTSFIHSAGGAASGGKNDRACTMESPLINNIFSIKGKVNDTLTGTFLLDTGANSSMFFKGLAESAGLGTRRGVDVEVFGAGGREKARLVRIGSLDVCDYRLEDPVVSISQEGKGISLFKGIDGIIGNDILERFNIVLNYRDQEVTFKKNSRFQAPFFTDKSGIIPVIKKTGEVVVHTIIPHSPASRAGVRCGDVIAKVNGKKVTGEKGLKLLRDAFSKREGKRVKLLIKRGKRRFRTDLRLKSYI